jgi:5'-3' exonuclease
MGVNRLWSVIEYLSLSSNKINNNINKRDLSGRVLAVDAVQFIYRSINSKNKLHYHDKNLNNHILTIFNIIYHSIMNNINTVWVFDSNVKSCELKKDTYTKRSNEKNDYKKKMEDCDLNQIERDELYKKSYSLRTKHVNEVKKMLEMLGIPILQASGEADILCAEMNKQNLVDGVITDDWDGLLFGSEYIIKYYNQNSKIYKMDDMLNLFNMNKDQFTDFCILLGTDYNNPVSEQINPVDLYNLFIEHECNTEEIIRLLNPDPNNYLDRLEKVKKYYTNHICDADFFTDIDLSWKGIRDYDKLEDYLCNKFGLNNSEISSKLRKIGYQYKFLQ